MKEAQHLRVQELVQRIENHPHREALQADLQQNNVNNSFSKNSKEMIRELGNVELFELCETIPKVQCSHCLLYRNQGITYCSCGKCLIDSESRRKFNKLRLDALSIPNNVIKKSATHGARHGKTVAQRECHMAWNALKRCCKKVDSQGEHFTGIHNRFLRDPVYRESQLAIGWSEQKCQEWDELAKEDHTYKLTPEERRRYKGQGYLTLNKEGKHGPMKLRSDYRAAVMMKNRLHHKSGHPIQVNKDEYNKDEKFSPKITSPALELTNIQAVISKFLVVVRIRMELEVSSLFFFCSFFCYSWFRLQSMAMHCNRRGVQTDTPHTRLFLDTFILVHTSHCGSRLKVSQRVSA